MALSMHVDPFAVEDPSELPDWRLPLSFMKSRHTEKIKGDELSEDSWRMKDRVRRWYSYLKYGYIHTSGTTR